MKSSPTVFEEQHNLAATFKYLIKTPRHALFVFSEKLLILLQF